MAEHQQAQKSSESKSNTQTRAILPKHIPISHPAAIIQRARVDPKSLTHADVMQLQRTIGNRAVGKLLTELGLIPSKAKQTQPIQMQTLPEKEEKSLQGKFAEPLQRQEIPEEEEPLQGKFESGHEKEICPSCIQRQETPEEKEPLQGKMTSTIQLQEIPEEKEPLQGKFESIQRQEIPDEEPFKIKRENNTGMPDNLKAGVENLSKIDMSDVRVHYNSDKPAEVGALAYTQGTDIHVAPGQERHLPHEAWHVVQQAQGRVRPTFQMKGVMVNDDAGLELEADVKGMNVLKTMPQLPQYTQFLPRTFPVEIVQRKTPAEIKAIFASQEGFTPDFKNNHLWGIRGLQTNVEAAKIHSLRVTSTLINTVIKGLTSFKEAMINGNWSWDQTYQRWVVITQNVDCQRTVSKNGIITPFPTGPWRGKHHERDRVNEIGRWVFDNFASIGGTQLTINNTQNEAAVNNIVPLNQPVTVYVTDGGLAFHLYS